MLNRPSLTSRHSVLSPPPSPADQNNGNQLNTSPLIANQAVDTQPPSKNAANAPAISAPSQKGGLREALGHKQNWQTLGQMLNEIAARLGVNATPEAVLAALKSTPMEVQPGSPYPIEVGSAVPLETYIISQGLAVPKSHFGLSSLADFALNAAQEHPLGNFGGALSWQQPLDASEQRTLLAATKQYAARHPNPPRMGASIGVLEYLNSNTPLSGDASNNPAKALETIVSSPRAQALGLTLQTQLKGLPTDTSVNDFALTAINLVLDSESVDAPHRNKVAGFDLAQEAHWGKPLSVIRDGLIAHLVDSGKTGPEMAKVGAHLLLARKAPLLLIKDIPASVTYGSAAWVNLSIAAATIEAQTPGKLANMTFAQVMTAAENAGEKDTLITQQAQKAALIDWGIVNNIIAPREDDNYNHNYFESVRTAFNQQLNQRMKASRLLETEIPSRKEIALAKLKERFGENVPFEEKLLTVKDTTQPYSQPLYNPNRAPAGLHSLLDIAMSGLHHYEWETKDQRILDATKGKSLTFDVNSVFNTQFTQAVESRKEGIDTAIKHMIAALPLADRQNFEYGKLEFYQNNTYMLSMGFSGKTLTHKNDKLLVKATGVNGEKVYEIDLKKGAITSVRPDVLTRERERTSNLIYPIEIFTPTKASEEAFSQNKDASIPLLTPSSFLSPRTQSITDAFIEHLDIDGKDAVKQAKGQTTFDQQMENEWKIADFFLNLIPLRSAIVNFQNGNYADGAIDLAMDIFGFVTAGAATAAKVMKVGAKALSTTSKTLRAARIIGAGVVSAFNPLGGLDDLVKGVGKGGKFLISEAAKGINKLKGATGSYDLLKAASRHYDAAAIGTVKIAGQDTQIAKVLKNGQWYNYDVTTSRAYGLPQPGFKPTILSSGGEVKALSQVDSREWLTSWFRSSTPNPNYAKDFEISRNAALSAYPQDYNRGYSSTTPPSISGYNSSLSINEIKQLSLQSNRTAEELGSLARRIEDLEILPSNFYMKADALKAADAQHFKSGYQTGKPESIGGYSSSMNISELQELALQRGRSTEDVGCLFKQIELKTLALQQSLAIKFNSEIRAAGGSVNLMPQGYYLSQVKPDSAGQCAALANAMAYAIENGKEATLIENFFTALAHPEHLNTQNFRNSLQTFQAKLRTNFHGLQVTRNLTVTDIINELASASTSKSLLIGNNKHGISAGVVVNGGQKEWFYYDPNFGLAKFPSEEAMRNGLERTMNSGSTSHLFRPDPSTLTYSVSDFYDMNLINTIGTPQGAYSLFARPIVV